MFHKILIVCTGNICRSPMAEVLLSHSLGASGTHTVESAGIGALVDDPADPIAVELMGELGLDISGHRARQLTPELGTAFDLILVMEYGQKRWIEERIPPLRGRVYTLGHWSDLHVPDPYRKPRTEFEQALDMIQRGVKDWAQRIQ